MKVLAVLLVSMTTGAIVLMVLSHNPPSAGPFCLSAYYRLSSVDHAMRSQACQWPDRWDSIEIFFSGAAGEGLSPGAAESATLNCHFLICNGHAGGDGEIRATEKWRKQWSAQPSPTWQGSQRAIRIGLVGDGVSVLPTDYQLKRLELLLEALCRKFSIRASAVYLPRDCE